MQANLLFSTELLQRCIASKKEMDAAKLHGRKIEFSDVNGSVTAYAWNGEIYVAEMEIIPEAGYR